MKVLLAVLILTLQFPTVLLAAKLPEKGLPFITNYLPTEYGANTQNWSVVQNKQGLMYFGNNRGVLEYDGTTWRLIPISNQSIARSLAIDATGKIFVGGVGEFGYLQADSTGKLNYQSLLNLIPAHQQDFSDVWTTLVLGNDVYFQTFNRLYRYSKSKITSWPLQNSYHRSFIIGQTLYVRQQGIGLTSLVNNELNLVPGGDAFADDVISAMLPLDGKILIGARTQGLLLYNPVDGSLKVYNQESNASLADAMIYHGAILADGRLAFATIKNGLTVLERDGSISLRLTRSTGLPYNTVYYLYTDQSHHLWVGSAHGISRIEISSPFSVFSDLLGLDGGILALTRFKDHLYVGTHQGVYYLNDHSHFEQIEGIYTQSWQVDIFTNPQDAKDQHLLVASTGGLYEVIGNKAITLIEGRAGSLSMSQSDPKRVYIGMNGQIASLQYKNGRFLTEGTLPFHQDEIRSIQEDTEGNIWIGTMYNGLYRIKTSDYNKYIAGGLPNILDYAKNYQAKEGLPTPNWNYLHLAAGRMLVTTQKGIYQYNYKKDKFIPEPILTNALNGEERWFYYIKEDSDQNLWFDSDQGKGVFVQDGSGYRLVENQFKRIVVAPENQVAGYAEENGIKWFGTPDGLFRYQRNDVAAYSQFKTLIRKVILGKDSVIFYGNVASSKQNKPSNSIEDYGVKYNQDIDHQHNQLTFYFSATTYENRGSNLYSYYLKGYDTEWSDWSSFTTKEYTNLPPGDYSFSVRGKNFYDIIGPEQRYSFTIAPPWHQTYWAYAGFILAFIGIIAGASKINSYRLKKQNRVLEQMVSQRTTELVTQKTELEKQKKKLERSNRNVTTLSQIGQKITATLDLRSIINTLHQSTSQLMEFDSFGIGLYNEYTNTLDFVQAYEGHKELPPFTISISNKSQLAVWCFNYKKEVLTGNFYADAPNYLQELPEKPSVGNKFSESVIYMPLLVKDKVIGVITLQSFKVNAYKSYQADIVRTLAAYTAVALDNSYAYLQLNEINEELNATVENLKQTQGQLVQSEKMASLGQLTAGVAHEINNPINFVSAGIDSLSINYSELHELLELYRELSPEDDCTEQLIKIDKLKKELDLDYLLEEIPQLLKSVKTGANRTTEIVKSLRNFTRLDEENLKKANLEEGLESTLVILRNKFKDRVKVVKHYGNVPAIACYPGQINQAFMNIIGNAVQAIEGEGVITLKTEVENDCIIISISDSGKGMPEEVQNRIFEPFYTTKDVGEGTGLGLSITYGIIEKHQGKISVSSQIGAGTTFIIQLPIKD